MDQLLDSSGFKLWPLVERSSDGVALVAADTFGIVIANLTLATWLGTTPEQLVGQAFDSLLEADCRKQLRETFQQSLVETAGDDFASVNIATTDGNLRAVEARFIRIDDASGGIVGIVLRNATATGDSQSRFESLTGLPDRTFLHAWLTELLDRRHRSRDFAILFVDINNFKEINDRHGHLVGDRVLREAAGQLRGCLDSESVATRYGGDEFVVLVESATIVRVESLVAVIKTAMSRPIAVPDGEVSLSVSVGMAMGPAEFRTPEDVVAAADRAMYAAKRGQ